MPVYRAMRDFHFGAIRTHLKVGDPVFYDSGVAQFKGRVYDVSSGFNTLVSSGFLSLDPEETALLPAVPQKRPMGEVVLALKEVRKKVESKEREEGRALPAHLNPEKEHIWESGWGGGSQTCKTCGVTMESEIIYADKRSLAYTYTDAYGVSIKTLKPLPCPVFVGDLGGGVAENTYRTRKLTGRVESIDERVERLESENAALMVRSERRQEVALDLLERLVRAAERLSALGDNELGPKLLPDRSDIIDAIVVELPEKIRVGEGLKKG